MERKQFTVDSSIKGRKKKVYKYRFSCRYKDVTGQNCRYSSKWYDTKEECHEAEFKFKNRQNHTTSAPIGSVGHACIEDKKDRITSETYKEQMMIFDTWFKSIHDVPIDKVKPHQIKACFESVDHLSTSRKNKGFDILNGIFEYAITYYGLEINPMRRIPRFKKSDDERLKRMDIWTVDQFNQFMEALPDILKYKAFFRVLFFTGLRKNEALSLTWSDFDGQVLHVWRQWQDDKWKTLKTKNSQRDISLDSVTVDYLNRLRSEQEQDEYYSDDWFIFYGPKQMATTPIDKVKEKAIKDAGLPYIRIHDFRHSHASYLINKGVNMYTVSRRLGHSSIQMTIDRYTHLLPDAQDEVIQAING